MLGRLDDGPVVALERLDLVPLLNELVVEGLVVVVFDFRLAAVEVFLRVPSHHVLVVDEVL